MNSRKQNSFRPGVEQLEQRDVPSATLGPLPGLVTTAALTVEGHLGQANAPQGLGAAARALMPQDGAAFRDLVVRVWKDPDFRDEVVAAAHQFLPANPAGFLAAVDALLHPGPGGGFPPPGGYGTPPDGDD